MEKKSRLLFSLLLPLCFFLTFLGNPVFAQDKRKDDSYATDFMADALFTQTIQLDRTGIEQQVELIIVRWGNNDTAATFTLSTKQHPSFMTDIKWINGNEIRFSPGETQKAATLSFVTKTVEKNQKENLVLWVESPDPSLVPARRTLVLPFQGPVTQNEPAISPFLATVCPDSEKTDTPCKKDTPIYAGESYTVQVEPGTEENMAFEFRIVGPDNKELKSHIHYKKEEPPLLNIFTARAGHHAIEVRTTVKKDQAFTSLFGAETTPEFEGDWQLVASFDVLPPVVYFQGFVVEPFAAVKRNPHIDFTGEINLEMAPSKIKFSDPLVDMTVTGSWHRKNCADRQKTILEKSSSQIKIAFPEQIDLMQSLREPGGEKGIPFDLMVEIVSRTAGKAQFKYCENIDEAAFDVSFPGFYTPKKDPAVFMADYTRSPGVFSFSENLFFDHPNPSQPFDSTDPIPYYVRGPDADLTLKVKIQLEKKNFGKTIRSGNLFLMPVAFNLAMWKEAKDRRSRFVGAPLMGYAIYGTTPGAYAGPVPLAFGTRKNTGDKEGPGLDPDAPKSLNPAHPKVAQLIKEWISVAEPPSNATHGNNFHFSNQGVAIGQGKGFTAESRHESGQFDPVFLWKYKRRLDSVNHCTLEEYVIAKLKNLSIEHCKGRYRAGDDQHSPNEPPPEAGLIIPNLIGKKASEAKATLIDKGFKVTLLAGKPAPTHEQAFTVTHTRPQPGTVQKKGETVEITVFVDYAPTVKIPAVAGLTTVEARKRLQDAGFNVSLKTRGNSPDPDTAFKAMGTDPKVDMAVPKGSTITLISFGPYKERVEMPLLLGLKISQAELELEKLGLEVYSSPGDAASTKQDEGLVTAQDPAAGKTVSPRSKIKLTYYDKYVWEGSMPDLTGLTVEKAKKILEANKVRIYANSGIPASATLQVNTIYKQSLPKNSAVREGDYVTVTIYSKTKEQWVAATDCLKYPGTEAFWNEKTNTTGCRCKTGYVLRNDKSGCDKKAEPTPLPAVVKHPAKTQEPVKPSIPVNTGSKTTPPTENNTEPNEIQLSATACERIKNPGMPIDKATRDRTADETKSAFKHLFTPIFTSIYGERSQDPWKMQVLYRTHKNSTRTVTAIHVQVQYKTTPKDYQTEEAISLGFYFNDVDPSAAEYDAAAFIKKVKSYKGEIQSLDGMPVYANPDRRTWTWATPDTRMLIVVRGVDKNKDYLDFAKKVHQHLKTRGLYDIRSKLPCW